MKKQKGILNLVHSKKALTAYVIVGLVYSVISVVAPSISGDLVNSVIYGEGDIKFYLILLVLTYLFLLVLSVLDQHALMSFKIKEKKAMRNKLFSSFLKKKGQNNEQVAAFSSFVNNDMPCVVEDYYAGAVDIIKCICIILCVAVKLLDVHWLLALVIVGSSILITAIPNTMRKYVGKVRGKYGAAMEDYNGAQHSLLSGANTVKVTGFDKRARDIIQEKNEAIVSEEKKLNKSQLRVVGVAGGMQILKRVLILAVGVYLIYIDAIKVGGLLVAVQLAEVLAMPAEMLAYMQNARNQAKPLVEKYDKLTSVEDDLGQTKLQDIQNISVEHLSYEINDVKIIKDFSYTFEKGKKYMLTGPSGCGKSTFLSLLEKLQEGTYGGSVRINDVSLNDVSSASLYEKIGVAFQEPYLFGFSLKENIIMGRDVSDGDYVAVMKKLNLDYLLDRFANNELNTEMVSRLSGGEKQRIALARAMVGKPQVYMLDEITSSLDEQNAREIEEILLAEDATILYVCHKIISELKDRYEEVAFA